MTISSGTTEDVRNYQCLQMNLFAQLNFVTRFCASDYFVIPQTLQHKNFHTMAYTDNVLQYFQNSLH